MLRTILQTRSGKKDKPVDIINGKEVLRDDNIKSFQEKKWFKFGIGILRCL